MSGLLKVVVIHHHLHVRLYLGQVYRKTDRLERAKDCFIYALELERTQPIQPFSILPRCI